MRVVAVRLGVTTSAEEVIEVLEPSFGVVEGRG